MRSCLSIKICVFSLFSRISNISNRHLTYTAYSVADFWASGVYLVCIWKKRDYIAVVPYILVGRARFELATNGLKVRCSTDWATVPSSWCCQKWSKGLLDCLLSKRDFCNLIQQAPNYSKMLKAPLTTPLGALVSWLVSHLAASWVGFNPALPWEDSWQSTPWFLRG